MALGHIGPTAESAVPALIEALQDKSNGAIFLRPAAATALGEIGQPVEQVVPTLIGFLRGRTICDLEIEPAVCALGRIGPGSEPAIPTLLDLLESQPTTQTEAIRRALVDIGPAAMKAVATRCDRLLNEIGQTDMAARVGAGMTLRKMGPLALPPVERSLKNDNARVRIGAARAVVWLDAELQTATLSSLSGLLGDPDMSVQWEAVQSLAEIGPRAKPAVAAVMELLKSDDANDRLRNLASWALKQIDPDVGIPPEQGDNRDGNPNSNGTDVPPQDQAPAKTPASSTWLHPPLNQATYFIQQGISFTNSNCTRRNSGQFKSLKR